MSGAFTPLTAKPCNDLSARIADWLRDAADDPNLIVVTHGIVSRVLRGLYVGLSRLAALSLPIPQNRIFRLAGGHVEEISIVTAKTTARLTNVTPLPDFALLVEFDDGVGGMIDDVRARLLDYSAAFLDEATFRQIDIDDFGGIRWSSGRGLSAEIIYQWLALPT